MMENKNLRVVIYLSLINKNKKIRWEKICYIFWTSFYVCTSIQGFWKIRNTILSQTFNQLIHFIISISLLVITLWGAVMSIFFISGYKKSIKSYFMSLTMVLIECYLLFGYVAFYYPLIYMDMRGKITDNQLIAIFIVPLAGMCLPKIIYLIKRIYRLIRKNNTIKKLVKR